MNYHTFDTVVAGTGAAGYNAACEVKKHSDKSVCIITEGILCGTSRNTGSDKQTYYKLSLSGSDSDSVRNMAENLFCGGCVDGDNALCEAALSSACFYNLCALGVPFPSNRYGEYIGYKTDHDPYMRATSAGPLTSKFMTQALEKQAKNLNIPIFDNLLAVHIIAIENSVEGLLCLDRTSGELILFRCCNIVLATGGPAGIYENTVYPVSHTGFSSLALEAGAALQNMTEWQYGLSSTNPKWNVSGTYMQVLPRFVSTDDNGNEYEFLTEYFSDIYKALSMVFLKGYQWPFDSEKAENGSSVIDLAVYNECVKKGRRVYLDFTKNPFGLESIDFSRLSDEAYTYLKNADALFGCPSERLEKMNSPAIELYKSKGTDITKNYLEINLCAQHNNGGIAVDLWWQTSVKGLFAAGECAGTHGIKRPGGSALNAGQAGSLRAALYISQSKKTFTDEEVFLREAERQISRHKAMHTQVLSDKNTVSTLLSETRKKMSACAAAVRNIPDIESFTNDTLKKLSSFPQGVFCKSTDELTEIYKYRDTLIMQCATLMSISDYWDKNRKTRGSAIYVAASAENKATDEISLIREVSYSDGRFTISCRKVRPIPPENSFFENEWRTYRENKNIY